jgi:hypothetical protein
VQAAFSFYPTRDFIPKTVFRQDEQDGHPGHTSNFPFSVRSAIARVFPERHLQKCGVEIFLCTAHPQQIHPVTLVHPV